MGILRCNIPNSNEGDVRKNTNGIFTTDRKNSHLLLERGERVGGTGERMKESAKKPVSGEKKCNVFIYTYNIIYYTYIHIKYIHAFIHTHISTFNTYMHSFTHTLAHLFTHTLAHLFTHAYSHIHSYVHSLNYSSIHE